MATIQAIVFEEEDAWVAQALEVDVAAYGATRERAIENLRDSLNAQVLVPAGERLFAELGPAPPEVWEAVKSQQVVEVQYGE